jgi:signal transduction histidine kinase
MQQTEQTTATGSEAQRRGAAQGSESRVHVRGGQERRRVETVVETLATLGSEGETLAEVAHDARNMVTALGLYCDLLEEPGVLALPYTHYGHELRLVASASRRLVEKIVALDAQGAPKTATTPSCQLELGPWLAASGQEQTSGTAPNGDPCRKPEENANRNRHWDLLPAMPVSNLAAELLANRNLLCALAGPSIGLTVDADGGAWPVRLTGEDLTRVLVNLVKNAAEAMPGGGRIAIGLRERPAAQGAAACLALTIEDNGPGIPAEALETIFTSGYTTRGKSQGKNGGWTLSHRGLGLAITRSIVEGAGGRISAGNREKGGARFEIELPVRKGSF